MSAVRIYKSFPFFDDPEDWARTTLLHLYTTHAVETLAALKDVDSLTSESKNSAIAAAHFLRIRNPTMTDLRSSRPFTEPLILPDINPGYREDDGRKGKGPRIQRFPSGSIGSKTWARKTLLAIFRKFGVKSLQALLRTDVLTGEYRELAMAAAVLLGEKNPTEGNLKLALRGPKELVLPNPKQRPDIPTPMRD